MKMQRHTKKEWKTQTGVQLYLWKWMDEPEQKAPSQPKKKKQQRANDHDENFDPFL